MKIGCVLAFSLVDDYAGYNYLYHNMSDLDIQLYSQMEFSVHPLLNLQGKQKVSHSPKQ